MARDKWLFYFFLLLIVWAPIPLGSHRPWAWALLELASFTLVFFSLLNKRDMWLDKLTPYRLPIGLFLLVIAFIYMQTVQLPISVLQVVSPQSANFYLATSPDIEWATISLDVGQTQISLIKSIAFVSLFVCTLLLVNSYKRVRQLLLTIIVVGIFEATYGTVEVLSGATESLVFLLPVKSVATGTFVYKNHYANYLLLCAAMGVGYLVSTLQAAGVHTKRERLRNLLEIFLNGKAAVRIGLAIIVIGLVMSRSRMGNAAFFAAFAIVGVLGLLWMRKKSKGLTFLIVSMLLVDLLILSSWFGLDKVQERLAATSLSQETRDEVVEDSLPIMKQFVVFGAGMGSYYTLYPSYQGDDVSLFYDHAHNDYLQFIIELGALGTSLLALLVTLSLVSCIRTMRERREPIIVGLAFGCLVAVFGMLIHISVDFPLQAPANASLFCIVVALGLMTRHIKKAR